MNFCDKYRLYQEEHGINGLKLEDAIRNIKERPYEQYKEGEIDGVEPLKNEKLSQKKKLRKYIKKIKITNLRGDEDLPEIDTKLLQNSNEITDKKIIFPQTEIDKRRLTKIPNPNNPFKNA